MGQQIENKYVSNYTGDNLDEILDKSIKYYGKVDDETSPIVDGSSTPKEVYVNKESILVEDNIAVEYDENTFIYNNEKWNSLGSSRIRLNIANGDTRGSIKQINVPMSLNSVPNIDSTNISDDTIVIALKGSEYTLTTISAMGDDYTGYARAKSSSDKYTYLYYEITKDKTITEITSAQLLENLSNIDFAGTATGNGSIAYGNTTEASGDFSAAYGHLTKAIGGESHAEGLRTTANGSQAHTEGCETIVWCRQGHAEGYKTVAGKEENFIDDTSKNSGVVSSTIAAHAEGSETQAIAKAAHAEGNKTIASGTYSHAEGSITNAVGSSSHAEGTKTYSLGNQSHAEGYRNICVNSFGHAEGKENISVGQQSHVDGCQNIAIGSCGSVRGKFSSPHPDDLRAFLKAAGITELYENDLWGGLYVSDRTYTPPANGNLYVLGIDENNTASVYKILQKITKNTEPKIELNNSEYFKKFPLINNFSSSSSRTYADVVGNGTSVTNRSNAYTLDWNGNAWFAGNLECKGFRTDSEGNVVFNGSVSAYGSQEAKLLLTEDVVDLKIDEIIDSAPDTLNTLNKISKSLNNDAKFANTVNENLKDKVDKVTGKSLSSNDFTDDYKTKLDAIEDTITNIAMSMASNEEFIQTLLSNIPKVEEGEF